jgi:hypothetical protein
MKTLSLSLKTLLFLSLAVFLQSCFESEVPITTDGEPVPKKFLGVWYEADDYESSAAFRNKYIVTKEEDNSVVINKFKIDSENKWEGETYKGHFSKVNNVLFLNLRTLEQPTDEETEETVKYYLYKVTFDGDVAQLDAVTDDVTEIFESSKDLYDYVAKNMNYSFFFEKDEQVKIIKSKDAN